MDKAEFNAALVDWASTAVEYAWDSEALAKMAFAPADFEEQTLDYIDELAKAVADLAKAMRGE